MIQNLQILLKSKRIKIKLGRRAMALEMVDSRKMKEFCCCCFLFEIEKGGDLFVHLSEIFVY